jgi:two-component system CheB/CheR fusion protein
MSKAATGSGKKANRMRGSRATPTGGSKQTSTKHLIVGIGASAGGLEAFQTFFANMPSDSGMAFVLVQHLSPDHKSMLAELVGKATTMTVKEAQNATPVAANCVYVIPPDATLRIKDRRLQVVKPAPTREHRRPIDTFFLRWLRRMAKTLSASFFPALAVMAR